MKFELISDEENEEDDMITLSGCGKITKWKFPEEMERCPVTSCQELFDSRDDAINHYKEQHATKSILCNICKSPITTFSAKDFENHFKRWHPNDVMPFEFPQKVKKEIHSDKDQANKENTRTNDLITLTGCREITYWSFPQTGWSHCQVPNCQELFDIRSEAVDHFKVKHAKNAIHCKLCDKPIITYSYEGFNEHYRRVHPNVDVPFGSKETEKLMPIIQKINPVQLNGSKNDGMKQNNDGENDLITLGEGLGFITQFKFSEANECPVRKCEIFDSRSDAIAHYKQQHAKYAIFCEQCNRPLSIRSLEQFRDHYQKLHPDQKIPLDLHGKSASNNKKVSSSSGTDNCQDAADDMIILEACGIITKWQFPLNSTMCPATRCNKKFGSRAEAIAHYKQQHAKGAILCEICNKPLVVGTTSDYYIQHFERVHPFKRIPFNLNGSTDDISGALEEVNSLLDDELVDDLIILNGCGEITKWHFPSNITRCPVHNCSVSFSTRSVGIAHYKEKHTNAILCTICQKPVGTRTPHCFVRHYREKHPGESIPYNFDTKSSQRMESNLELPIENGCASDTKKDEQDDLITLSGCDEISEWRFPEMSQCPLYSCSKDLGVRSLAISHFKIRHAKNSVFCSECDKPIGAKSLHTYFTHYTKRHPNAKLPTCLKKYEPETYESDNENEVDDLITLSGCGQITKFRFPKSKRCPVQNCPSIFEKRSEAIHHYKKSHSKNYIFCSICAKPINAKSIQSFIQHYKDVHPNEEVPLKVNEDDENEDEDLITLRGGGIFTQYRFPQSTDCPSKCCNREFDNRSDAIVHYKIWHALNFMFCFECEKPVCTNNLNNYKEHYEQMHPQSEILSAKIIEPIDPDSKTDESESDSKDDDNDEEDDLITLNGSGVTSTWRFPDVNICPYKFCPQKFRSRSKAILHYKNQHADYMVLCPLCDQPVSGRSKESFIQHYEKMHPYQPIPYNLNDEHRNDNENETQKELENGYKDDEDVDDLITLEGCGKKTQWHFPKTDWTRCPVLVCKTTFKLRSHAILHYKEFHARDFCFCTVCEKPVYAQTVASFLKHYQEKHPGVDPASNFEKNIETSAEYEQGNNDDLITLSGLGQIDQWRFPKKKEQWRFCPVSKCSEKFEFRWIAINHFKRKHAKHSVYCPMCDSPVSVKQHHSLVNHYDRMHPGMEKPSFLSQPESDTCDDDEELDDSIVLGGGDTIAYWRFPKTRRCPTNNCSIVFRTRADVITHYKIHHAPKNTLCSICDKPVNASDSLFSTHYKKCHPGIEIPKIDSENDLIILKGAGEIKTWQFPNITNCPVPKCPKQFENRTEAIIHYKKKHIMNYQYCDICKGPVPTHNCKKFSDHLKKDHGLGVDKDTNKSDSDEEDDWILLSGGDQITQWQFPKNRKTCPVKSCLKSFGVRSDAITHYKKVHSMNFIFCTVCDKPISMRFLLNFNEHFRKVHPNHPVPNDLEESNDRFKIESSRLENSSPLNISTNEKNIDLIELSGAGHITRFRYPKITHCVANKCEEKFQTHLEAISHFKQQHSFTHTFCTICQKPIRVKSIHEFKLHYVKSHTNEPLPSFDDDIGVSMEKKEKQEQVKPTLRSSMAKKIEIDDVIFLEGCGTVTEWKFPEELTYCIMKNCKTQFTSRVDGITHFRNQHSKNTMYCSICDMPVRAVRLADFKEHYHSLHPDVDIDLNFELGGETFIKNHTPLKSNEGASCSKRRRSIDINESIPKNNESKENDHPDSIKLSGCGRITYWRFPTTLTGCPILRCRDKKFKSRSDAINHYREQHAAFAVYCSICDKPIAAYNAYTFILHYRRMHPKEKDPFKARKKDDKYLVELSGCDRTTYWSFPNTKRCPVVKCRLSFETRAAAMGHYKRKHAPNAYFCTLCNKPIGASNAKILISHYRIKHPGKQFPFTIKKSRPIESKIEFGMPEVNPIPQNIEEHLDEGDDVITLEAHGYVTKWKVPADFTTCPVMTCKKTFDERSIAIAHYKAEHSVGSVYCYLCSKPLRILQKKDLIKHYDYKHKNVQLPFNFQRSIKKEINVQPSNENKNEDEELNDQDDDVITLEGLGRIMKWRFPETNQCPHGRCRLSFRNRSAAIAHYKENHTKYKFLCPICKIPVALANRGGAVNLKKHFKIRHPNVKYDPKHIGQHGISIQKKRPNDTNTEMMQNEDDDVITLEGLGKIMKWQFPETNTCPIRRCHLSFRNRSAAIAHYKEKHSKKCTLCPVCKKPIALSNNTSLSNLRIHLLSQHPNVKVTKTGTKRIQKLETCVKSKQKSNSKTYCKLCCKSFKHFSRHMIEMHTPKKICCPLKDCSFETKRLDNLRNHWKRLHGNFKFPEIRRESGFAYKTNKSSDDEQEEVRDFLDPSSQESMTEDESMNQCQRREQSPQPSCSGMNKRKRSRRSSSTSSSSDDDDVLITKKDAKKRKLKNQSNRSEVVESPKIKKLKATMSDCSVVLDSSVVLDMCSQQLNLDQETTVTNETASQSQKVGSEAPTIVEEEYGQMVDNKDQIELLEPEIQMSVGNFIPGSQPSTSTGVSYNQIQVDQYPPESLMSTSTDYPKIVEVHQGYRVKEEKISEQPPVVTESDVFYVPDSDEEEEQATNLTNSNNHAHANDQQLDPASLHFRRMSVIMMVKKEFK